METNLKRVAKELKKTQKKRKIASHKIEVESNKEYATGPKTKVESNKYDTLEKIIYEHLIFLMNT